MVGSNRRRAWTATDLRVDGGRCARSDRRAASVVQPEPIGRVECGSTTRPLCWRVYRVCGGLWISVSRLRHDEGDLRIARCTRIPHVVRPGVRTTGEPALRESAEARIWERLDTLHRLPGRCEYASVLVDPLRCAE